MKKTNNNKDNNNNNNNRVESAAFGRPPIYRWPGLELEASCASDDLLSFPRTRQDQLRLIEEEAAAREKKYAGDEDYDAIEIDFENMRFDTGPDGAHTTFDFDKLYENSAGENDGFGILTTSDFIVFNRIKKIMFGDSGDAAAGRGWEIIDIKLNQYKTALFYVVVRFPAADLKLITNKYYIEK